jgi:hypothetical protein
LERDDRQTPGANCALPKHRGCDRSGRESNSRYLKDKRPHGRLLIGTEARIERPVFDSVLHPLIRYERLHPLRPLGPILAMADNLCPPVPGLRST